MRKRFLFTVICALSVVMTMAQTRTNLDVAGYFVKGYLSTESGDDGKPIYKLSKTTELEKSIKRVKNGKFYFGINGGFGVGGIKGYTEVDDDYTEFIYDTEYNDLIFSGSIGFDFAFPVSETINIGFFTSFGYGFVKESPFYRYLTVNAGPLMLINFDHGGLLYFGAGAHFGLNKGRADGFPNVIGGGARIGYKFKNGLYLFVEENIYGGRRRNSLYVHNWEGNEMIVGSIRTTGNCTLFHIGYMF